MSSFLVASSAPLIVALLITPVVSGALPAASDPAAQRSTERSSAATARSTLSAAADITIKQKSNLRAGEGDGGSVMAPVDGASSQPAGADGSVGHFQLSCRLDPPPKNLKCPFNSVMVDLDPSPRLCWACMLPLQ